jgi:cytochrome c-type biogenesis protein CcmE
MRDPARKRRVRLVVSLTAAVLLGSALIYTSFTAANDEVSAGHLLAIAKPGRSYQLAGTVVGYQRQGRVLAFRIRDPRRADLVAQVRYTGIVPDPFRVGRGVIVTVHREGSDFIGERDSLVTKCPSKFQAAPPRG